MLLSTDRLTVVRSKKKVPVQVYEEIKVFGGIANNILGVTSPCVKYNHGDLPIQWIEGVPYYVSMV